jgi:hypothetical protein
MTLAHRFIVRFGLSVVLASLFGCGAAIESPPTCDDAGHEDAGNDAPDATPDAREDAGCCCNPIGTHPMPVCGAACVCVTDAGTCGMLTSPTTCVQSP